MKVKVLILFLMSIFLGGCISIGLDLDSKKSDTFWDRAKYMKKECTTKEDCRGTDPEPEMSKLKAMTNEEMEEYARKQQNK